MLPVDEFRALLEYMEEIEDALDLEKAIEEAEKFVPWEEFKKELRENGKIVGTGLKTCPHLPSPLMGEGRVGVNMWSMDKMYLHPPLTPPIKGGGKETWTDLKVCPYISCKSAPVLYVILRM